MRAALEEAKADLRGNLKGFPAECCDHAANLLLLYFDENRIDVKGFVRVVADLSESHDDKHIWLEKDGVVIDITADQFAGRFTVDFEPVIVTAASEWHASLRTKSEKLGDREESVVDYCSHLRRIDFYDEAYAILRPFLNRA